jgi:hypothetical protein
MTYETKEQQRERFLAEFLQRIREAPPGIRVYMAVGDMFSTHPTNAVLSDAGYFAKRVTLSLALRSSGDAGRGFRRVGAAAALVAG